MKLRIRGNSIRLRLGQTEVATLREGGVIEESVAFAGGALVYAIERRDVPAIAASFDGKRIAVAVPNPIALDFCDGDRVGFEGASGAVRVLVEKDWQCLAPRGEDESDAYPHPEGGS
ncbi:MAG TPA: hypothetical protein VGH28_34200 [Polyangiaceae bacterium]|jgi:hypothetical protein